MKNQNSGLISLSFHLRSAAPYGAFFLILAMMWHVTDLRNSVPAYGDVLEFIWGGHWYGQIIRGQQTFYYPLVFHPEGWNILIFANGSAAFLPLLFFKNFDGLGFNVVTLFSIFLAFTGMYGLCYLLFKERFSATMAGLLYAFWGFRWVRLHGHLNINLGSALLPFFYWFLLKGETNKKWLLGAGLIWGFAIGTTFYFFWIFGLVWVIWLWHQNNFQWRSRSINSWKGFLKIAGISPLIALLTCLPFIIPVWLALGGSPNYALTRISGWAISPNLLPLPNITHQRLSFITQSFYSGVNDESSVIGFGIVTTLILLFALRLAFSYKKYRPLGWLVIVGIILAMGPVLKWNGTIVEMPAFNAINQFIWQIGNNIKPRLFPESPPHLLQNSIPLPWLWLSIFIPFLEGARVVSRFIFVTAMGVFPLIAFAFTRLKHPVWRWSIAFLLLFETLAFPIKPRPFPPEIHPAYTWLKEQDYSDSILEVQFLDENTFIPVIAGATLYATTYHQHPTAAGASSIWPAHSTFLITWLVTHHFPLSHPNFHTILQSYDVRYLFVTLNNNDVNWLQTHSANQPFQLIDCFPPTPNNQIWPHEICVLEVLEFPFNYTNVTLREGWSGQETWGVWIEGEKAVANWFATAQIDHWLQLEIFPHCASGKEQQVDIWQNETKIFTFAWSDCEPLTQTLSIPASQIHIGQNKISFEFAYALSPATLTNGENSDPRPLSAGFTRLEVNR